VNNGRWKVNRIRSRVVLLKLIVTATPTLHMYACSQVRKKGVLKVEEVLDL
jgi:hypothetical protein